MTLKRRHRNRRITTPKPEPPWLEALTILILWAFAYLLFWL